MKTLKGRIKIIEPATTTNGEPAQRLTISTDDGDFEHLFKDTQHLGILQRVEVGVMNGRVERFLLR